MEAFHSPPPSPKLSMAPPKLPKKHKKICTSFLREKEQIIHRSVSNVVQKFFSIFFKKHSHNDRDVSDIADIVAKFVVVSWRSDVKCPSRRLDFCTPPEK